MKTMQMQLDLEGEANGHPDKARDEFIAVRLAEGPTGEDRLMETICGRENMLEALKRVEGNKGAPGVDGMKTAQLRGYLLKHWEKIKGDLLSGTHQPMPVRRAEIPKESGGVRLLGIPTALDRLIQQAAAQALSPLWEHTFSERSYGFRPGRSAHMAIGQAREYVEAGFAFVVDIDLSKFFDRVNHDRLMMRLATRIRDKRVLKLIRAYLNSGVLVGGVIERTGEGTPQGGPLSPLLANNVSGAGITIVTHGFYTDDVVGPLWQNRMCSELAYQLVKDDLNAKSCAWYRITATEGVPGPGGGLNWDLERFYGAGYLKLPEDCTTGEIIIQLVWTDLAGLE